MAHGDERSTEEAPALLTSSDVLNREFRRAVVGGYRTGEVDDFCEEAADTIRRLHARVQELEAECAQQREALDTHHHMEESLRSALVTSQKMGKDIVETARREADSLIEAARQERGRVELERDRLRARLEDDLQTLESRRKQLRDELRAILETHVRLLDEVEADHDAGKRAGTTGSQAAERPQHAAETAPELDIPTMADVPDEESEET
jgi:cell division initiation protein